MSEDEDLDGH